MKVHFFAGLRDSTLSGLHGSAFYVVSTAAFLRFPDRQVIRPSAAADGGTEGRLFTVPDCANLVTTMIAGTHELRHS